MSSTADAVQKQIVMPDDSVLMKQTLDTHAPDGREVDCQPLMMIVEGILYRATPLGIQEAMQEKSKLTDADNAMLKDLPYVLSRISSEMAYRCSANSDPHASALSLLQILSTFPWDAKLVLLLAAFVLNYGEFWLVQIHASSKLSRRIAVLKQVPKLELQKKRLGGINNLIKSIVDLARCVLLFKELPPESSDLPEVSTACGTIPAAIYWATRGIVMCAMHTNQLITMDHEYAKKISGILENDVPALAEKIRSSNESLNKQLDLCYQSIEKKKDNEAYKLLVKQFEAVHIDNMKPLRALINAGEDQPQLIEGSTKKTVNLDVLRRKHVLLLISGLFDSSSYELLILSELYKDIKQVSGLKDDLEILWIPILENHPTRTDGMQRNYENCLAAIPWYSVRDPNLISQPVKRFVREQFYYRNSPIIVALDPQGKVSNHNAFDMMLVWGSFAFPFTKQKEEALWREESWKLDLIVDGIDPVILEWMTSGAYIILYGGDDMQWINKFTSTAHEVAQAGIPLKMVYVGKRDKDEQEMSSLIGKIKKNALTNCWEEVMIWFFWTRLRSMLFSKIQLSSYNEHDPVVQEIKKLLIYDGIGTWAMLCRGSDVSFTGCGPVVLEALQTFNVWKEKMPGVDFLRALKEQYYQIRGSDHPCYHLELQTNSGRIPENMVCPECDRSMEQSAVYSYASVYDGSRVDGGDCPNNRSSRGILLYWKTKLSFFLFAVLEYLNILVAPPFPGGALRRSDEFKVWRQIKVSKEEEIEPKRRPGAAIYAPGRGTQEKGRGYCRRRPGRLIMENIDPLLKQILAKHAPDEQHIDCNAILKKAEEIFTLAMAEVKRLGGTTAETEGGTATTEEEEPQQDDDSEFANHSDIINRLSVEIANFTGEDGHQKTMSVLTILSKYSFEAKLALSIAALALNYGQCLLLTEVYLSDKIPEHMAILKGMTDISQLSDKLKSCFSNLSDLIISSVLDLAKKIVKLAELIPMCSSIDPKALPMAKDIIPLATYWGIRAVVACAEQVNSIYLEDVTSAVRQWEISSLAHKMDTVKQHVQTPLDLFQKHIVEKMHMDDGYIGLTRLHETTHIDNIKVLKAIILPKDDELPLTAANAKEDEPPKTSVIPEALRGKTVLLLISELDIAEHHDFALLRDAYEESRTRDYPAENQYEVVWIPVSGPSDKWTHDMTTMFERNRSMMPWTVADPNKIDSALIKSIKERFHYQGQPIVAVLDPHATVVNNNAIDMIWIWGNFAFPFSKAREEALWKGEILRPELIVDGLDTEIENWVKEGKYIVIYGGDDVEWISKFVTTTCQAKQMRNIPLEMIYVGKSNQNVEETNRSINWIKDGGIGHYLPDTNIIWLFWNRMDHIKRSKIRAGSSSSTSGEDKVLQGITKMLSYGHSGRWASLFKGQELIAMGDGDSMLLAMTRYCEQLEENANKSFDVAFKEYFDGISSTPTARIILPGSLDTTLLSRVLCPECDRVMEKFIMFRCSHGL
ncbi:hypothetical protein BUALT_Bualt08G0125800 [Buddleja alternifolia]|uniref:Protein SIEVE ELEMENT OCCLUSION B n=1 Tax=Buddleja alternifolia TaxID=168488 RepID=A0AAV6X5A5_9LAMI|nr:hypothetical protein BUALT_Bualt08G0125800 [Buddleja alternifolia]